MILTIIHQERFPSGIYIIQSKMTVGTFKCSEFYVAYVVLRDHSLFMARGGLVISIINQIENS